MHKQPEQPRPIYNAVRNLSVILLFVLILGVSQAPHTAYAGGTLAFARANDANTLDPGRSPDLESSKILSNVYEGLVAVSANGSTIIPALAKSWETSADKTEWVFHLRNDVTFHDGTPFTADAVVFSFMRQLDSQLPYFAGDSAISRFTFRHIEDVKAVGPYTVLIRLDVPFAPFLHNMSMSSASVISPNGFSKGIDADILAGTGPYRAASWEKGKHIVLSAHPHYWNGAPELATVVIKVIPEASDRLTALKVGFIDAFDGVTADIARQAAKNDNLTITSRTGLRIAYLAMNTQKKPFTDVRVRKAVNMVVNKEPLQRIIYGNTAVAAYNVIPDTVWSYDETIQPYPYDPAKARQLLAEAGYQEGFTATLYFCPCSFYPSGLETILKSELAAINVTLNIRYAECKEHLRATSNGEHDMCIISWGGYNSGPDNFFYPLFHPESAQKQDAQNRAFYTNLEVRDLIEKALQETGQEERKKIYWKIQHIIRDDAPWVPLVYNREMLVHSNNVTGLLLDATGVARFHKAHVNH
ncbi:ABC transporter substrate-binding protein [Oleidesulfovibrio sp.]|uniref:ABC transporter substrate-binding protein n=1 Tax=Oleidesulfovibrio sp. TaxID=2909707 RepID=UPI003A898552